MIKIKLFGIFSFPISLKMITSSMVNSAAQVIKNLSVILKKKENNKRWQF